MRLSGLRLSSGRLHGGQATYDYAPTLIAESRRHETF